MNLPARSPDLTPIELAWDMLSRRIRQRQHPPDTLRTLIDALVQEWQAIPQNDGGSSGVCHVVVTSVRMLGEAIPAIDETICQQVDNANISVNQ